MSNPIADKLKKKVVPTEYAHFTYVIASTLNQMVNYIPWKLMEYKEKVYVLTITGNEEFDNSRWNEYLRESVPDLSLEPVEITQKDAQSIEKITSTLNNSLTAQPILWNITGGQRTYFQAVMNLTQDRPQDRICYIEGNTETLTISRPDGTFEAAFEYHSLGADLDLVLGLMGFNTKSQKRSKKLPELKSTYSKQSIYTKLYEAYCKDERLRASLISLNLKDTDKTKAIDSIKACLTDWSNEDWEALKKKLEEPGFPFGYLLEEMAVAAILNNDDLSQRIADLHLSASLSFSDDQMQKSHGGHTVDEFDIALVSTSGKLIVFECKSGGMSGDVAKSTRYSVYAAAGVYGKPILITPLLRQEINGLESLSDNPYRHIKAAVRSARRANLEVWGMDELVKRLKERLKAQ